MTNHSPETIEAVEVTLAMKLLQAERLIVDGHPQRALLRIREALALTAHPTPASQGESNV